MSTPVISEQPPALEFAFSITAEVTPGLDIEDRTGDVLKIIPITGGPVTGKISGRIEPGGADWCRYRADGAFDVEARYWIKTDSGDIIDVVNIGHISPDDSDRPGLFMSTPSFRTASPELQWLTQRVFVGRAQAFGTHTTIDIFEVVS